jgi:hypothetical protein
VFPSTRGHRTRRKIHHEKEELIAEDCDYYDTARLRTSIEKASVTRLSIRLSEPRSSTPILAAVALASAALRVDRRLGEEIAVSVTGERQHGEIGDP